MSEFVIFLMGQRDWFVVLAAQECVRQGDFQQFQGVTHQLHLLREAIGFDFEIPC